METYEKIIFENMSKICFGSNVLDQMIELTVMQGKGSIKKQMNIVDVIHKMSNQLGQAGLYRKLNPIGALYYGLTGRSRNFSKFTKQVSENARVTREFLRGLIQKRKSEQMKSEISGNADLLSLFLSCFCLFVL